MKFIALFFAVIAVVCTVHAAPAPQVAAFGSPLTYSAYSGYSPYAYSAGGLYSPYSSLGYSNLGYSVGGLASPYAYYG